MERRDQVFVPLLAIWSLKLDWNLNNLVVPCREDNEVFLRRERDGSRLLDVDIMVDNCAVLVLQVVLRRRVQIITRIHTGKGFLRVGIVLDKDTNTATFTSNNETASSLGFALASRSPGSFAGDSTKSGDCSDRERVLTRVRDRDSLVFAVLVEEEDLALVVTDDKATVAEPGMAGVVRRVVTFVLSDVQFAVLNFEVAPVQLVVSVELIASDDNDAWVHCAERHLLDAHVPRNVQVDKGDHALLVPVPNDDTRL